MKKLCIAAILMLVSVAVFPKVQQVVMNVHLDCHKCEAKIKKNIAFEDGVEDIKVNVRRDIVAIKFENKETNPKKLVKAFKEIGYTVTQYVVDGKDKVVLKK